MNNLFNEIEKVTEAMTKPTKKGIGARMREAIEGNAGSEWVVHKVDPEYKKKLNDVPEVKMMTYSEIRDEMIGYVDLWEHNYLKRWNKKPENKEATVTIVNTLTDQLNYITGASPEPPKSILLYGESGKGKSTIMKEFMRSVVISKYRKLVPIFPAEKIGIYHDALMTDEIVFIDDLGMELNHTRDMNGNFISKDELASRTFTILDHRRKHNLITNVTTNLGSEEMLNLYGARSGWRFEEIWDMVEIK
jgi:predicted AAA+ superfamily ATPase